MSDEIKLGDKVRDIYTGYTGIAMCKSEFLNGCVQYTVAAKWDGKAPEVTEMGIDSQSLEVIKPKIKPKPKKESNGGPIRKAVSMRGY